MKTVWNATWPVLREYDLDHLARIAMPIGGIGTGTISIGGRGDLRDWEVMNRPSKGYVPASHRGCRPSFILYARAAGADAVTRLMEGPLDLQDYEGAFGATVPNHGLPRFRRCRFASAYPFAQVRLDDDDVPVGVRLEAFNPLVPADADASGLPVAVVRCVLVNAGGAAVDATVCGSMPNFVGRDGSGGAPAGNRNAFRTGAGVAGIAMDSAGVKSSDERWGTMALVTTAARGVTYRTSWLEKPGWGTTLLDFWDDLTGDGRLSDRGSEGADAPMGSVAVSLRVPAKSERAVTFLVAWHFPNRQTWSPCSGQGCDAARDTIGNYYTTRHRDAWHVAEDVASRLDDLEARTATFVRAFCESDLPAEVREAALFNLGTLRSQTCFRTPDGLLYGWEGCSNTGGCCTGSCTHVWNYEQAVAFLFGGLARGMREVEFAHATDERGLMSFRVNLPLERAQTYGRAAADGQMGCLMKLYRDWQLSGDDAMLRRLWPRARAALAFAWVKGGWDADRDGVMEGCQHNTMDVEYYGPNPQMGTWYLGALRAAEEMARHLDDADTAAECRRLFERGSRWTDEHIFNGEFYVHEIRAPSGADAIAEGLRHTMGADDVTRPDYQLGEGCLVDQLVGQYMAHVCGLGYLLDRDHVRAALAAIMKYNYKRSFRDHFNCLRSFVLGDEAALLMAAYPTTRPANPFPYFTEVMTGFEYTAAVHMLQEGMVAEGLECIRNVRARYDGRKRNPFDEAECGHHYARAMASWGAVLALSGFRYSAQSGTLTFAAAAARTTWFWSTGDAWGTVEQRPAKGAIAVELTVLGGRLAVRSLALTGAGQRQLDAPAELGPGDTLKAGIDVVRAAGPKARRAGRR